MKPFAIVMDVRHYVPRKAKLADYIRRTDALAREFGIKNVQSALKNKNGRYYREERKLNAKYLAPAWFDTKDKSNASDARGHRRNNNHRYFGSHQTLILEESQDDRNWRDYERSTQKQRVVLSLVVRGYLEINDKYQYRRTDKVW